MWNNNPLGDSYVLKPAGSKVNAKRELNRKYQYIFIFVSISEMAGSGK